MNNDLNGAYARAVVREESSRGWRIRPVLYVDPRTKDNKISLDSMVIVAEHPCRTPEIIVSRKELQDPEVISLLHVRGFDEAFRQAALAMFVDVPAKDNVVQMNPARAEQVEQMAAYIAEPSLQRG